MGKMESPVMPNLIPRLLSDGALRRVDSDQEPVSGKKWMEWVLSFFNPIRVFGARARKY